MEVQIFNLIVKIGEILNKDLHIIKVEETIELTTTYRVYHEIGFCIDAVKKENYDDESGNFLEPTYFVYQEWDGFEKFELQDIYNLIKKSQISF